jgi:glycosyltransferase involved in cell wall biosynthesis
MTHEHARRLVGRGHEVTLFAGAAAGAPAYETVDGVAVVRRGGPVTTRFHARRWFREQRRQGHEFDVVIEEVNTLPYFAGRFTSVPTILYVHQIAREVWWYEAPKPLAGVGYGLEHVYLRLLRRSAALVPSESTRGDLLRLGFHKDRVLVVPNAIDQDDLPPVDKEPGLLAYVGRITPSKRIDHLIRALALVREQGLNVRLVAAGPGEEKERTRLLALARDIGVANHFELRGHLDVGAKRRLLASASLFLMASVREGWGLVVTEANALSTPAVVYDRPGLRDSTVHGQTGLVTHPSPDALAAAIGRALMDSRLYESLSTGAAAWAAGFTWQRSNVLFERALQAVAVRKPLPTDERRS